jgi:hypothetical protein
MILDAELRTFVQGKFSISDYCHCLKAMTDALGDLGEAVLDRTLVLAVLRGLNGRFAHMVSLLIKLLYLSAQSWYKVNIIKRNLIQGGCKVLAFA